MWQAPLGNSSSFRHSNCIVLVSALQTVCAKMNNGPREERIFLLIIWFRICLPNVCEYCRNKSRHWKTVLSQLVVSQCQSLALLGKILLCDNFSSLYTYVVQCDVLRSFLTHTNTYCCSHLGLFYTYTHVFTQHWFLLFEHYTYVICNIHFAVPKV